MKNIRLNDGHEIPQIGFGVFRTRDGEECINAVKWALEAGYRHIDTAKAYDNEGSVGKAIRESGIPREEIFLTTKLWNADTRAKNCREALERSLDLLQTDYVDLYLIHWPTENREIAWADMEELQAEGKIRSIGVSNFMVHHLQELSKTAKVVPAVNQIESHPYFNNRNLIDYCREKGITVEAWSPLGGSRTTSIRDDETINAIAKKYNKSAAQVIIRWHLQRDIVVLPKSVHEDRIYQNIDVFDFELTAEECEMIAALDRGARVGSHPDHFNF
ncbi:MAG: aldo/keto reductase [Lachnospiraceae bacterium]|nr:aldo/keto reductase [Lachnospiraceae bacterium]